jgi:ubiquinone/menaquinone biosynthesis C-methylase UbiE
MNPEERLGGLTHSQWNETMAQRYFEGGYHEKSWLPIRMIEKHRLVEVVRSLGNLQEDHRVLEVGCGPGWVLDLVPRGQLFGLELSEHLAATARHRLGDRAEIHEGNAEAIPFPDNSFDAVYCTEVLEHTLNPRTALEECFRVARPDAPVVFSVPNDGLIDSLKNVVRKIGLGSLLERAGPDGHADDAVHEWHLHQLDDKVLTQWAKESGASRVQTRNLPVFFLPIHFLIICQKAGT